MRFRSLGVVDGKQLTLAAAISDHGTTVAGIACDLQTTLFSQTLIHMEAVRWTLEGGLVRLGLSSDGDSVATGVNADGSLIVGYHTLAGWKLPFRWQDGVIDDLGWVDLPAVANDVSADGSVVVGAMAELPGHAIRWTASAGLTDLGAVGANDFSAAYAVSRDGQVAAGVNGVVVSSSSYRTQPVRWNAQNAIELLPILPVDAVEGQAFDVNSDGSVIVGCSTTLTSQRVALLWSANGVEDLGSLPGALITCATGVSADGEVVVGRSDEAMIWTRAQGMRALRDVLAESGVDLTGWTLYGAGWTSRDGKVVVGTGLYLGQQYPWIAWLP